MRVVGSIVAMVIIMMEVETELVEMVFELLVEVEECVDIGILVRRLAEWIQT